MVRGTGTEDAEYVVMEMIMGVRNERGGLVVAAPFVEETSPGSGEVR
jgi:hypothetical protein